MNQIKVELDKEITFTPTDIKRQTLELKIIQAILF